MFDNLKNLANLPGMLAKAREMQEKMKSMQDKLARKQVSADSGGGMVTAVVKMTHDKTRRSGHITEILSRCCWNSIGSRRQG